MRSRVSRSRRERAGRRSARNDVDVLAKYGQCRSRTSTELGDTDQNEEILVAGNQPYSGASGPSMNDAMLAVAMRTSYGALAYSRSTGREGHSYGWADQASAERTAIDACATADARVQYWGFNIYIALAVADNGAYGFAGDQSSTRAQLKAAQACDGPNVRITLLFHTRRGDLTPDDLRKLREHRGVSSGLVILGLLLCGPLGLVLVPFASWKKLTKVAVFGIYLVVILLLVSSYQHR
jgi:hypothetical protein